MEKSSEKRRYRRIDCPEVKVDCKINNRVYTKWVHNISAGGVFVRSEHPVRIGNDVSMVFSDYLRLCLVQLTGSVIRKEDGGFGVAFRGAPGEGGRGLGAFISGLGGD